MKIITFIALLIWQPLTYALDTERLTDEVIPFAYESRAEIPASNKNLARLVSIEYRRANDEFTKHELMQKIKPILKTKLDAAKSSENYILRVGSKLGKYDFERNVFPSGFSESTFIPFKNGYAVTFENGKKLEFIPLAFDKAKELSSVLQRSRRITAVIYVTITGVKEEKLNWKHNKALVTKINKVEYFTNKGKLITKFKL